MPEFPFKEARLVNSDKPFTVRWYIVFWVWDALQHRMVRKRDYQVNNYKTRAERLAFSKKTCRELNKALLDGKHINAKQHKEQTVKVVSFRKDYTVTVCTAESATVPTKPIVPAAICEDVLCIFIDLLCIPPFWQFLFLKMPPKIQNPQSLPRKERLHENEDISSLRK